MLVLVLVLVDSRLKISLEKKSRQIQAESSDFILNPEVGGHLSNSPVQVSCQLFVIKMSATDGWYDDDDHHHHHHHHDHDDDKC